MNFRQEQGLVLSGDLNVVDSEEQDQVVATLTFDLALNMQGRQKSYKLVPNTMSQRAQGKYQSDVNEISRCG
jgi:hypothetical protein